MRNHRQAFTLVELAVVLVIIGLLVGAVMAGKSMIQAQKVRNVLADAVNFATSMQQFKDKYGALPGDMPDAERVWGNAEGGNINVNCATPYASASSGAATCNGNGNGVIDSGTESYRTWQQLAAAGYITGSYTGVSTVSPFNIAKIGVNIPEGALKNTGYFIWQWGDQPDGGSGAFFAGNYDNVIAFGAGTTDWPHGAALTTAEASGIDVKMDDGLPGKGTIRSFINSYNANCTSTNVANTAVYQLGSTNAQCILLFMRDFDAKKQ